MDTKPTYRLDPENTSVHDAIQRVPGAGEIIRRFGIDTCCGGELTLSMAADHHDVSLSLLLDALEESGGPL